MERIAPRRLAEAWDNVGLILDARGPSSEVSRVVLTIDLTEAVLDEALGFGAEAIVSYHPVLFAPVKRLGLDSASERVVVRALRAGLAVYSPHSALDAAPGGLGDWLVEGLGRGALAPSAPDAPPSVVRRFVLAEPVPLAVVVERVKQHLGLGWLRVAASRAHRDGATVARIAICPGAGGSAFEAIRDADVFLTGEMRHHDVLARVAAGASVILSEHTHTERGYLPLLARRLVEELGADVGVRIAEADRDPLALE
jgi:dinuclear metal center YbgI/SA1388 family protein